MSSASATTMKLGKVTLVCVMFITLFAVNVNSLQFDIGGKSGWKKSVGNDTGSYNFWAKKNRFHIGDTLYFKYLNDSVLVVNKTSYKSCIVSNPIAKFEDGNTIFKFDRYGYFYFISGQHGHCKAGEKLIVRVMVHPLHVAPQIAPSPSEGRGDGRGPFWHSPSINSTVKASIASYLITAAGAMLVILYLLV